MSIASMPRRASISLRISLVQGSAPKTPMRNEVLAGSTPCRNSSSAIVSMYDGVARTMVGLKSIISCTCFSVCPPDIGITVAPSASPP